MLGIVAVSLTAAAVAALTVCAVVYLWALLELAVFMLDTMSRLT